MINFLSKVQKSFSYKLLVIKGVNFNELIKYFFSKKNSIVKLTIYGVPMSIRKGTPDLSVVISCFTSEFEILKYLYPENYKGVIIDAGGYIGASSIALSKLFPNANIIVIEPSLENFALLKLNIQNHSNIRPVNKALSFENKFVDLFDRSNNAWGYTIINNPLDSNLVNHLNKIEALTLDSLGVDVDDIGLIKMDIEGAERDIFTYDKLNYDKIPYLFVELHDRIISDCSEVFFNFSSNRIIVKDSNEKYLSIKR